MLGREWTKRVAYLRTYVLCVAVASVLWESAQMPLYMLWERGTAGDLAADVLKCTGANIVIATSSLVAAFVLTGRMWPWELASVRTVLATCLIGVGYTVHSEWVNVYERGTWAYSDLMSIVPGLDVGLSPLIQWVVLPSVGILVAKRWSRRN